MTTERWFTDHPPSERWPHYTRANAGEVLPTPASPLGQTYGFDHGVLPGFQLGSTRTGFYELDEYRAEPPEMCGFFGGYFYINLANVRMQAVRNPAVTIEQLDTAFFGDHPDVPAYTPHPDDEKPHLQAAADALHTMVTSAQGCCDAEGVTFLATDLAEDGGKIIMVAGFPTTAEDDQGRLLRASRRIITDSLAQGWPLAVRAGLNRGHVFAGAIGSFERATVTVMGDTVNLAARVMAKADPGTVLATPSTLDNAQTLFATEPVEPFMVKGKSQPVSAYKVGGETGTRPPRGLGSLPFVGRDDELHIILDAIDGLTSGTGSVITITGDVGMGKTRLLLSLIHI